MAVSLGLPVIKDIIYFYTCLHLFVVNINDILDWTLDNIMPVLCLVVLQHNGQQKEGVCLAG